MRKKEGRDGTANDKKVCYDLELQEKAEAEEEQMVAEEKIL